MIKRIGWFILSATLTLLLMISFYRVLIALFRVIPSLINNNLYLLIGLVVFIIFLFLLIVVFIIFLFVREWRRNKAVSLGILAGMCLIFGLIAPMQFRTGRVYACQGLHNAFNAKRLLESSDVVVKVQVISSTGTDSALEDFINYFFKRRVAVVKTLIRIKGEVPEKFVIKYPKEYPRDCSHIRKGNIAIVFLKKDPDGYRFLERLNEQIILETETTQFSFE